MFSILYILKCNHFIHRLKYYSKDLILKYLKNYKSGRQVYLHLYLQ